MTQRVTEPEQFFTLYVVSAETAFIYRIQLAEMFILVVVVHWSKLVARRFR